MLDHLVLIWIANLLLGAVLGALGGMMGIGGGLMAIPVLAWVYGMDQHAAQGTALVMIVPNVLIGFLRYRQRNRIDLRSTLSLALLAMLSTYVAARYAALIDPARLRVGFALFLIALACYFSWQLRTPAPGAPRPAAEVAVKPAAEVAIALSPRLLPVLGVLSGLMSGLFSVGGGLVVVPALVTFFRMTQTQAQGIAMALVLPGALVALFAYAHAGHVHWGIGIPLALGGVATVSWGVALAHRMAPRRLRRLFCLVLFGTAVASLLQR
ncbi:MAG: sulfite exporter TauE/SafE family protein [Massilia sp.]|nr:sulfite exporter TauE/SafE family protein [Massilia sp.]